MKINITKRIFLLTKKYLLNIRLERKAVKRLNAIYGTRKYQVVEMYASRTLSLNELRFMVAKLEFDKI